MNIYCVGPDVYRFQVWNLARSNIGLYGHYTVWWRRTDRTFVLAKHGDYGGLTWFPRVKRVLAVPTPEQEAFLRPMLLHELRCAYFREKTGKGPFFLEEIQKREDAGEYNGGSVRLYHVSRCDEFADQTTRELDTAAVKMLEAPVVKK